MKRQGEIPPTAGLPMVWHDWLPTKKELCSNLSELFNLPPLILECSGTASLIVALQTLANMPKNEGRRDVIIPAYNCPLVVLAIAHCNLTVKLCDTAKNSFDFDFDCLDKLVDEKTLAIVPAHIGGQLADVKKCVQMAHKKGAYVIEDGAQALGSAAGKAGDIAFFSLAVGKGLTVYEGGLLTSSNDEIRLALKETHKKIVKPRVFFELKRISELLGYSIVYRPRLLSLAYGMPRRKELAAGNIEEAVGDVFDDDIPVHLVSRFRMKRGANAASRLKPFLEDIEKQAQRRIDKLAEIPSVTVVKGIDDEGAIWPFIMVLFNTGEERDKALETLWPSPYGVTRLFVHALPDYSYLEPHFNSHFSPPNARDFTARMLTISNSPWLDDETFDKIVTTIARSV
ncbi:DegT/DnrJ/EryC1/StrS family aminotransferase [Bartonella apis]|uniref:DegT/DnrJ/EryC1/StrS family aminotransferase n=1 Tax=Bartonella apis TaxID=1686310 RepID=UPI0039991D10